MIEEVVIPSTWCHQIHVLVLFEKGDILHRCMDGLHITEKPPELQEEER